MSSTRAAFIRDKGGPFHLEDVEDVEVEQPRPHEMLVRVVATGRCHTDLLAREQVMPPAPPVVLGHEGSGVVEAVGAAVRSVAVGNGLWDNDLDADEPSTAGDWGRAQSWGDQWWVRDAATGAILGNDRR